MAKTKTLQEAIIKCFSDEQNCILVPRCVATMLTTEFTRTDWQNLFSRRSAGKRKSAWNALDSLVGFQSILFQSSFSAPQHPKLSFMIVRSQKDAVLAKNTVRGAGKVHVHIETPLIALDRSNLRISVQSLKGFQGDFGVLVSERLHPLE